MKRRSFLNASVASAATMLVGGKALAAPQVAAGKGDFPPIDKSLGEWKSLLSKEQYHVLFEEGTERPYTSPLNKGCSQPAHT